MPNGKSIMPKAANHLVQARQWEMLCKLPNRAPGISAKELTERLKNDGFDVTKRTVERDLISLSTIFGISCNDKGTPYGWYWTKGEPANLPGISVSDAVSMSIVEELLRPLLPAAVLDSMEPRFKQAKNKLDELEDDNTAARWVHKVRYVSPTLPLLPPKVDENVLFATQEALLADRQLLVQYQKNGKEPHELRLHPLALVQRGPATYLVATAFDYEDVRLYAMHRIVDAQRLEEAVVPPPGFSLDDYVASGALHFGKGETIKLVASIAKAVSEILTETPLSADQRLIAEDNKIRLEATVADTWQLHWWILSHGADIVIEEPASLRDQVAKTLVEAAKQYQSIEHP